MGAAHKISIALTPELAAEIDAAIATGDYASTSEVIREALREWKTRRIGREAALEELRRLIQEGIDSGEPIAGGFDAEDIKRRGRERLAALREGK
jgi:antitoxin ParD1/3/4